MILVFLMQDVKRKIVLCTSHLSKTEEIGKNIQKIRKLNVALFTVTENVKHDQCGRELTAASNRQNVA